MGLYVFFLVLCSRGGNFVILRCLVIVAQLFSSSSYVTFIILAGTSSFHTGDPFDRFRSAYITRDWVEQVFHSYSSQKYGVVILVHKKRNFIKIKEQKNAEGRIVCYIIIAGDFNQVLDGVLDKPQCARIYLRIDWLNK